MKIIIYIFILYNKNSNGLLKILGDLGAWKKKTKSADVICCGFQCHLTQCKL